VGIRKNGDEFPAEAAISKLQVGNKAILTVALRDITERKRVELEQVVLAEAGTVLASSLNYRRTLKSIAEMVVHHVADICVIDMIEEDVTVERLTVAHSDPAKAAVCEVLGRLSLEPRDTLARSALETGQPQVFDDITLEFLESSARDEEHLRALLELAPRSAIVVPLLSTDSVLGALVVASSRPHCFGAREVAFATELARRAALAIANARLYEAAQRASRARDEVLGIVAHDVRSPLNAIGLAADLLGFKLAGAEGTEQVESILRSVSRANRLIEDLLDVTRIDAGVLGLERRAAAVEQVLDDAITSQQLAASAASIELRLEIDDKLPLIWADRHRVLQVLDNLIGNALKFTPKRGHITIAAVNRGGEVLFSVADTGAGIPEENLRHVFDRFWQAKRAERRGAGLGLQICKGIVEAHGGRIWAESVVGRGTTFFFTLPTTDEVVARPEQSALFV
ncbi:MAG TPA: GAF domain-containing sensor histidine kinase, partial [Kofleriaceae bacterium]|nr:GAF domain-containing sensor histidine kinase [Kofleriaceae bacterium]